MAYSADTFVADEQPTTAKWNKLWANDASFNDGTGFADGAIATAKLANNAVGVQRLSGIESTDIHNGTALTVDTWTDFKGNQNFTVDNTTSLIIIAISGRAHVGSTSSGTVSGSRCIIDSAGTPITRYMGGNKSPSANTYANPFAGAGPIVLTGLAAGVHTVKTQVLARNTNSSIYCRVASTPLEEWFRTEVLELKK